MKKLLVIVVLALSTGSVSAQEFVEFGAKAGINFASLSGDGTEGWDGVTSFHLGLIAEFPLTEKFSVQPEILYSGLGASGMGATASDGIATWKLDYISIPVMLKYYVIEGLFLQAGPKIAFNVVAEVEAEGETNELKNINSTDFGAGVGVGYEFPMGLFFDARYTHGLSNIWDAELDGSDVSQKNKLVQFSVGYKF